MAVVKKIEIYMECPEDALIYRKGNFWGKGHVYRERLRVPLNRIIQIIRSY